MDICGWERQLNCSNDAHEHAHYPPKHGGEHKFAHDGIVVRKAIKYGAGGRGMRHERGFRRCSMNYGSRSRDIGERNS